MVFTFYIDGLKTDTPQGDRTLKTTVKRDAKLGGLLVTKDAEVEYFAKNDLAVDEVSGYTLLKDKFYNSGFCSESVIQIFDNCDGEDYLLYTGVIKYTQIEIDEQQCSIKFKIQDNSFYSYINNNLNIKVALTTDQTKNKQNITPLTLHDVDCFHSSTGNYGYNVKMYNANEALSFIVRAITDNKVGFASDYLDGLEPALYITTGQALREFGSEPSPAMEVSFNELFNELNYQKNLGFFIDVTDPDNPFMRVEEANYLFNQPNVYSFADIKDLTTRIKIDKLYSTIVVGSTITIDGDATELPFNEGTSYFGFKEETFYPLGQCAIENELNLVNKWAISSNAINWQLEGSSTDYDSDYFIIEVNDALEAEAYDFFGQATPPFFYNLGLNNVHKLQNHASNIYANVVNFFGIGGYGFRAGYVANNLIASLVPASSEYLAINTFRAEQVVYADETSGDNFDGGGNYNNITGDYTLPLDGNYSFLTLSDILITGLTFGYYVEFITRITHYDATKTTVKSESQTTNTILLSPTQDFSFTQTHSLNGISGDVVESSINYRFVRATTIDFNNTANIYLQDSSYFTCNGTPTGGQTLAANDTFKVFEHEFNYHIPASEWMTILASPAGSIEFEKDGSTRTGWIEQMVHDDWTGNTQIKLISSNATTT